MTFRRRVWMQFDLDAWRGDGVSPLNRAVLARRQPGSVFKPFVYAAAIDRGFRPDSIILDAPISLPNGARGLWSPRNFSDKYLGPVKR